MLRRTETSHRFYLQRPMVFLFSRPILPYYNKGKKTIYSYLNFIFFFLFLSDCVAHSANLECVRINGDFPRVPNRNLVYIKDARAVRPYRSSDFSRASNHALVCIKDARAVRPYKSSEFPAWFTTTYYFVPLRKLVY